MSSDERSVLQLTLRSKLPSGRDIEDIRITTERTSDGTYLILKVQRHWHLMYKETDGRYYVLVDDGESRESLIKILRQYRINQTKCYIDRLEKMLKECQE